ncbi:MAG: prolyl-tRNA synthetase associated domain-containing protein [Deltaproteobacteria bacterium]|nr:prolyl-tRNA synthetase associated domain-containing protein [Deltaproteobacteria bacterium]
MDTASRRRVYERLDELGISYQVSEHPPVYTVEEMENLGLGRIGAIVKNLFLRDNKGSRHFLALARQDKKIDLKALRSAIGSTPLRFASAERLAQYLGLEKGAVSPFGLFNDSERAVEVLIDEDLFDSALVGVHPNDNEATVWLAPADLELVIQEQGQRITHLKV